jgi:uncharacterized coiled-coil DUF342 family protein|nr:MAG TPA: hypothetical protein [Caudoviricetes sp.]
MKGEQKMYKARKKNRVLQIADEKVDEYKQMGYTILDEADKTIWAPEDPKRQAAELKEKLEEATLYAENADKKIDELQKENAELKAKISELETKKTASRATKKAGQEV